MIFNLLNDDTVVIHHDGQNKLQSIPAKLVREFELSVAKIRVQPLNLMSSYAVMSRYTLEYRSTPIGLL